MAAKIINANEQSRIESAQSRNVSVKGVKKVIRNYRRIVRRKRSKSRYYSKLRKVRFHKNTFDLCSAVSVVDISDMDWAPTCGAYSLPSEVAEWQKQDQLAYWKSRAISLEFENKVLRQHLRNVYAKTIDDYAKQFKITTETDANQEEGGDFLTNDLNEYNLGEVSKKISEDPAEIEGALDRTEDMKKIYGYNTPKILAMETAMQLDFERNSAKLKPSYWPSVALNMKFN